MWYHEMFAATGSGPWFGNSHDRTWNMPTVLHHQSISCAYLAQILISCAFVVYAAAVQGPVETQPLAMGKF